MIGLLPVEGLFHIGTLLPLQEADSSASMLSTQLEPITKAEVVKMYVYILNSSCILFCFGAEV